MAAGGTPEALAAVSPVRASAHDESLHQRIDAWLGYQWVGAFLILAAIVLPLLRQQNTPSWQTVWAEDGNIYTQQAIFVGSFHALFWGYNGYLQLPPRLLAIPTPYFSLRYLAQYLALSATIVDALLAWSVYHLSRGWLESRLLRVTLASLVVLMPVLGPESTATITNTTWVFLAVLPWALISLEERRRDVILRAGLVFLAVTSSALSLLFLPIAIGWIAYRRTRAALIVGAAFLVGLVVQLHVTLTSPPNTGVKVNLPVLAEATSIRVFGVFLLGTRGEAAWWSASWESLVVLGPLIVMGALAALGIGATRRSQIVAGAFGLLSLAMFAIPAWGRGSIFLLIGPSGIVGGYHDLLGESRFSVVPVMLLASAFAVLIAPNGSSASRRRLVPQPFCIPAFAVWTLLIVAVSFPQTTPRGADPSWASRVDRVIRSQCSHDSSSTIVTVPNYIPLPPYYPNDTVSARCSNLA